MLGEAGWLLEELPPVRRRPAVRDRLQVRDDADLVTRQLIENRWRRRGGGLKHQIVAVDLDVDASGPRRLQGFCRTHSRVLHRVTAPPTLDDMTFWVEAVA